MDYSHDYTLLTVKLIIYRYVDASGADPDISNRGGRKLCAHPAHITSVNSLTAIEALGFRCPLMITKSYFELF